MPPGTVTAYFYISLKSADLTRPLCESIAGQSFSISIAIMLAKTKNGCDEC
jgi:hypothetical protein